MSRWVSAANEAAAELGHTHGAFLLDLAFDSGHVYANDSGADLRFGGNTYLGTGALATFDGVEENIDFIARGVRFELTGVDTGLIATIATEIYQGRPATLYIGLLDSNDQFIDTPEVVWSGFMDTMDIEVTTNEDGTVESKIVLQCEHRLRNAPPYAKFSDADQKARSSGDRFFDQAHLVPTYQAVWGGRSTTWNYKPGGGYTPGTSSGGGI